MNNINPTALFILGFFAVVGYLIAGTTGCLIGAAISLGLTILFTLIADFSKSH